MRIKGTRIYFMQMPLLAIAILPHLYSGLSSNLALVKLGHDYFFFRLQFLQVSIMMICESFLMFLELAECIFNRFLTMKSKKEQLTISN